jgi:predicted choloylglycine hydrolase
MCTTVAKRVSNSWILAKTRDPVEWMRWDDEIKLFNTKADKLKKLIIHNPDMKQDGYYGGINEKGVAIIATFLPVAENQISYIRRPYMRLLLDADTAKEAVEILKSFNPRIGGNMFIADKEECYGIEAVPETYHIEKVEESMVKTNHYVTLPNRNLQFASDPEFETWTKNHFDRATELLKDAETIEDFQNILKDRKNSENKTAICTIESEAECCTFSGMVFDTNNCKIYYCQGNPLENEFKEYGF